MLFRTHFVFGILIGLVGISFFSDNSAKIMFFLAVLLSSMLVDIDLESSEIGKRSKPLSNIFNFLFSHRGVVHSIWPGILIFAALSLFKQYIVGYGVIKGYFSHLLLDGLNKQGIRLFYPFSKLKMRGFVRTGGIVESFIFFVLIVGIGIIAVKYI